MIYYDEHLTRVIARLPGEGTDTPLRLRGTLFHAVGWRHGPDGRERVYQAEAPVPRRRRRRGGAPLPVPVDPPASEPLRAAPPPRMTLLTEAALTPKED